MYKGLICDKTNKNLKIYRLNFKKIIFIFEMKKRVRTTINKEV